jgi:hypothetical protein
MRIIRIFDLGPSWHAVCLPPPPVEQILVDDGLATLGTLFAWNHPGLSAIQPDAFATPPQFGIVTAAIRRRADNDFSIFEFMRTLHCYHSE